METESVINKMKFFRWSNYLFQGKTCSVELKIKTTFSKLSPLIPKCEHANSVESSSTMFCISLFLVNHTTKCRNANIVVSGAVLKKIFFPFHSQRKDIYRARDGKWLLDSMGIWNMKVF